MPDQITRRDTFAAMAMQAAATNPKGAEGFTFEQRATWAYMQADAMETARGTTDTTRLDWMLAAIDDDDAALGLARCLALGMTGREAIDAAAKRHPL